MNRARRSGENGIALVHVLMLMTLVTTAAAGAAMLARVEILVASSHQNERSAAYAAQAILAAALQHLDWTEDWNATLAGVAAGFADGPVTGAKRIPGGGTMEVCCGTGSMTLRARAEDGVTWQPVAWQSLGGLLDLAHAPPYYLAAWVVDDAEDTDGNVATDANDRLVVRAEAATPLGVRRALEVLVERAPIDAVIGSRPRGLRILSWREVR